MHVLLQPITANLTGKYRSRHLRPDKYIRCQSPGRNRLCHHLPWQCKPVGDRPRQACHSGRSGHGKGRMAECRAGRTHQIIPLQFDCDNHQQGCVLWCHPIGSAELLQVGQVHRRSVAKMGIHTRETCIDDKLTRLIRVLPTRLRAMGLWRDLATFQ